jgi:hypothetical protein
MTGHFDFTGPFPRWEDSDERVYEARRAEHDFNEIVDRLMFMHGLDRDEAEWRALTILEDDAA